MNETEPFIKEILSLKKEDNSVACTPLNEFLDQTELRSGIVTEMRTEEEILNFRRKNISTMLCT